jgi:hypothetical protein
MRRVIVNEWMSGGFKHGGWHMRYFDDLSQKQVVETMNEAGAFLFGLAYAPAEG